MSDTVRLRSAMLYSPRVTAMASILTTTSGTRPQQAATMTNQDDITALLARKVEAAALRIQVGMFFHHGSIRDTNLPS